MPFKSQAQRAMFYARAKNSPKWKKMAKKWSAHTPKGPLPKKVHEVDNTFGDGSSEDEERNGHEGFEVQDVHQDKDPLKIRAETYAELYSRLENQLAADCGEDAVNEMPHLDADVEAGGKHLHVVDLRIERYPVSKQEKDRLMSAFMKSGVVGDLNGELVHFTRDGAEVIDPAAAKQLPRLPPGWDKVMKFVSEEYSVPSMNEVFSRKR